ASGRPASGRPASGRVVAGRVFTWRRPPGRGRRRLNVVAGAVAVPAVAAAVSVALLLSDHDEAASPSGGPRAASSPGGALPADSDVPRDLRPVIEDAARQCPEDEVTPAFLAAMLKAESGFDADARRPETNEYGIAMWTPSVFKGWAKDGDKDGDKSYMSPPDAIAAMTNFVCWLDQQYKKEGMRENLPALMAAGYRTSSRTVLQAGGVPERVRPHVERVERYLEEYSR
uniref:transglycosylase SLT domain-containing protein n=1 Tax=Streptomyces sp. PU-14G TaxID=2800808 RepID=UPI0034DEBE6D